MDAPSPTLEYAHETPVPQRRISLQRVAALGYIALCVAGLVTMGVVMALSV